MDAIRLDFAGKNLEFPTEKHLRSFLLQAAERFHNLTGMPRTEIGQRALNDPAFLSQISAGRNFKVRTFESFLLWLDCHWPEDDHERNGRQINDAKRRK